MVIGSGQPAVSNQFEGEPPPPISTPWGAYRGATSYGALTLLSHSQPCPGRVRNPVVGHESDGPQVVFNVRQSHRQDSTHPSLFYRVGYHSYICGVQHSWAQSRITLWSNAGRMVTHPCINRAHDCLTSVIKRKMFAPCYVSPRDFIRSEGNLETKHLY